MTLAAVPGEAVPGEAVPVEAGSAQADSRQPAGLYLLFFTEMWERTSFYGMRALLTLYMTRAISRGGFGWSSQTSLRIYGLYAFMVYFTPLPGGYLADKVFGQRRSVMIGAQWVLHEVRLAELCPFR